MTNFKTALQICGLSHREAATFLNVRPDTVHSWSNGRNPVPAGVLDQLSDLYKSLLKASLSEKAEQHLPAIPAIIATAQTMRMLRTKKPLK